jgi:hypothetical protein
MQTTLAMSVVFLALLSGSLTLACKRDDSQADTEERTHIAAAALGARVIAVGEPLGTIVDSRVASIVPGLQIALNPELVMTIASAVESGESSLDTIAKTAGLTSAEFRMEWHTDHISTFERFGRGLEDPKNLDAIHNELFFSEITTLPVHPEGVLIGSGRIDRPAGKKAYFLIYDVANDPITVETTVAVQLNQSPWQVTAGHSNENLGFLQFQSTVNPTIEGVVWVLPLSEGSIGTPVIRHAVAQKNSNGKPHTESSLVYLIDINPLTQQEDPPFVLPKDGRPLPKAFPATFLLSGEQTVVQLLWRREPGGSVYQLQILIRASSFDVVQMYRDRIKVNDWELTGDQAIGFLTILNFSSGDRQIQGSASFDSFEEDPNLTKI